MVCLLLKMALKDFGGFELDSSMVTGRLYNLDRTLELLLVWIMSNNNSNNDTSESLK